MTDAEARTELERLRAASKAALRYRDSFRAMSLEWCEANDKAWAAWAAEGAERRRLWKENRGLALSLPLGDPKTQA